MGKDNTIIENEIKDVFDNIENKENKEEKKQQESKIKTAGFNIKDLPDGDEEELEIKDTTRTLIGPEPLVNELIEHIFLPLDITEENGLLQSIPNSDGNTLLKWETDNLSTEENEEFSAKQTIYKGSLVECLLFGRKESGLLNGIKDYNGKSFSVYPADSALISSSFEIITNYNKRDVENAFSLIQDTLKWTTEECNNNIFISYRPVDQSNINQLQTSLLVIFRSPEEMAKLSTAYKTMAFGKKANKVIDKANTTIYGGAKMLGNNILKPGAEVLGMTAGSLAGSMAQSIGVGLSEGANEFCKAFNLKAIKERPSTIELKNRIFKNRQNTSRGGVL